MTGAWADDEDLGMARMMVDEEMMVGHVGIHANRCAPQGAFGLRQETAKQFSHRLDFFWPDFAPQFVRVRELPFVMKGDLHAVA